MKMIMPLVQEETRQKRVDDYAVCCKGEGPVLFETRDYISNAVFQIRRCENCGLIYTYPQPSREEIKDFYPREYYDERTMLHNFFAKQFVKFYQWARIRKILLYFRDNNGSMLDIGCGRGWQLKYFQQKGWEVCGTELSEISSDFARKGLRLNVSIGDFKERHFERETFDVVSLWHVFEHLLRPKDALEEIWRITKKEGMIFVSVPNFSSWQSRISRQFWFHLDVPRHLSHFTPKSMERLLEIAGFHVMSRSCLSFEYGFFGIVQSLLNLMGGDFNFLWDLLSRKAGRMRGMSKSKILKNLALLSLLCPFYVPIGFLLELLSIPFFSGSVITVVARKIEP